MVDLILSYELNSQVQHWESENGKNSLVGLTLVKLAIFCTITKILHALNINKKDFNFFSTVKFLEE